MVTSIFSPVFLKVYTLHLDPTCVCVVLVQSVKDKMLLYIIHCIINNALIRTTQQGYYSTWTCSCNRTCTCTCTQCIHVHVHTCVVHVYRYSMYMCTGSLILIRFSSMAFVCTQTYMRMYYSVVKSYLVIKYNWFP